MTKVCIFVYVGREKDKGKSIAEVDEFGYIEALNTDGTEDDSEKEDVDIDKVLKEMRRERDDPFLHCEGDTDVEDLFVRSKVTKKCTQDNLVAGSSALTSTQNSVGPSKCKPRRNSSGVVDGNSNAPSDHVVPNADQQSLIDDGIELCSEEDDGAQVSTATKRRRKKPKRPAATRIWFDEAKILDQSQLCNDKREGVAAAKWEITPHYIEKLELEKTNSSYRRPVCAGRGIWQVSCGEYTYAVDLENRTCGCFKWDVTGIPCKHAISAIYKLRQYPEDYVNDFFKKATYEKAYQHLIYPVPGEHDWVRTTTLDIDPPKFNKHPSRPKKSRRKSVGEETQHSGRVRMTTITCSNCKNHGHKYTSCPQPLRPDLKIRKRKHKVTLVTA